MADRTSVCRTRLTKARGERLDQLLLGMLAADRICKADLEQMSTAAAVNGLPPQPVATLRTRLRRLEQHRRPG